MNYIDQYGVEYSEDQKTLLKFSKEQTIYVIPDGTEIIGVSAFKDCDKLTKLCIPRSLRTVESVAFNGCKHLTSIEYAGSLRDWLMMTWKASIECAHSLQLNGVIIKDIVIPEDIEEIKQNTFYYCNTIQSVKFHDHVHAIGTNAFNKSSLSGEVILPQKLKSLESYAFFNSQISRVCLPHSIEHIKKGVFAACYKLESFSLSENEKFKVDKGRAIIQKANLSDDFKQKTTLQRCIEGLDDVEKNTIIAFAGAQLNDPYIVPREVESFMEDTFCYGTLGNGGIWIKHEIGYFPKDAFRNAKGHVYVLPNLKSYYFNDIPNNLLEEKFDQEYAFKSDNHKITAVVNNPFRVLGVYANASQKDITANARKIKRYLEVGKDVEFPTDFNHILPPLKRTEEMVDKALADISTADGKWKNALFWFVNVDDFDEIALGHLQANNIEKAKSIWEKKYKWNTQLNLSSLNLLLPDITSSTSAMHLLYNGREPFVKRFLNSRHQVEDGINYEDFLRCILGDYTNGDIHHGDLEDAYFDGLLIDIDLFNLRAIYEGKNIVLNVRLEEYYQKIINNALSTAKCVNPKDSSASRKSMEELFKLGRWIDEYKVFFGEENKNIELLSDNFANQLLQAAINYYNSSTDDYDEEGNVIAEMAAYCVGFAESYATSQLRKDRCAQNMAILEKNAERVPPKALLADKEKLEELLAAYNNTPETIAQAYALLKECAPIICQIKEYREKNNSEKEKINNLLSNLCTNVVLLALNKLVAEVNRSTKSNTDVYDNIRKAREVMMSMKKFPMTENFRKDHFNPNSATLDNLYLKASPLGQIGFKVLPSVAGTYPILNVNTDEEVWKACQKAIDYRHYLNLFESPKHAEEARRILDKLDDVEFSSCSTKQNYENYLKLYPYGKHQGEAEAKLSEYKERAEKEKYAKVEKEVLKYLIFAFALVIFNTFIYATCTSGTFQGWVMFSCVAYIIKLGYDVFTKFL